MFLASGKFDRVCNACQVIQNNLDGGFVFGTRNGRVSKTSL